MFINRENPTNCCKTTCSGSIRNSHMPTGW